MAAIGGDSRPQEPPRLPHSWLTYLIQIQREWRMRATSLDCRNRKTTSSDRRDSGSLELRRSFLLSIWVLSETAFTFVLSTLVAGNLVSLPSYLPSLPVPRWSRLETTAGWSLSLKQGRNRRLRHARSLDISLSPVVCWVVGLLFPVDAQGWSGSRLVVVLIVKGGGQDGSLGFRSIVSKKKNRTVDEIPIQIIEFPQLADLVPICFVI